MSLAFDTSILIGIERRDAMVLTELKKLSKIYPLKPQLPFISYFEFLRGLKIRKPKRYGELFGFLNEFNVLSSGKNTARILADLKIKYDGKGIVLPLADLLIASQVIENGLILVTKDKDFEKVDELKKIVL